MNLEEAKTKSLNGFELFSTTDQFKILNCLIENGDFHFHQTLLKKTLMYYVVNRNSAKLMQILPNIRNQKSFKREINFFRFCSELINDQVRLDTVLELRSSYLNSSKMEQKSLDEYENILHQLFKLVAIKSDYLKNEFQLVRFIKELISFDEKMKELSQPKVMDFKKSWLIKQIILFDNDEIFLNYAILALLHSGQVSLGKELYDYVLKKNLSVSLRVKYWSAKLSWQKERQFKLNTNIEATELFTQEYDGIEIEKLLKKSEKPFVDRNEYLEILRSYEQAEQSIIKDETKITNNLSKSLLQMAEIEKVYFYLENAFYDKALGIALQQVHETEKDTDWGNPEESKQSLNWYYLTLFTLLAKKDYNGIIEFSDGYGHRWLGLGTTAVDLWYLTAEGFYALGQFDKALDYFKKVFTFYPDYRLARARIEEIGAYK